MGVAIGCLTGVGFGSAQAQTADSAPAASTSIEEIVVTARKRDESLIEVPVAITALTGDQLSQRGIMNISDLQAFTPNFRFQEAGSGGGTRGFQTFLTRGIFPGSDHPDRQAVSIFLDGVPVGGGSVIPGLTDVNQVEVVNGPQSAYFGRATFGGAVNFITATPGNDFKGRVDGSYWNDNSHELSGQVEGPIIRDKLSARISARSWKQGAQYKSFGYGNKLGERATKSVTGTLSFTPFDNLRFKLYGAKWEDNDGPAPAGLLIQPNYNCNAGAAPTTVLNYICGAIDSVPGNRIAQPPLTGPQLTALRNTNIINGPGFIDRQGLHREASFVSLSGSYDLPYNFTLSANAAAGSSPWAHITDLANRFSTTGGQRTFLTNFDIENRSSEIRLASDPSKPLNALIGVNKFYQGVVFGSTSIREGVIAPAISPTRSTTNTTGYFGAISYTFFDRLQLSAEGRHQIDKITASTTIVGATVSRGTTKSFTPRFIAKYKVSDDLNVYASYSEGTRPAQFNANVYGLTPALQAQVFAQSPVPLKVDEERLKMWEVGVKGSFFDKRLQLLAAAYSGEWVDRQINVTLFIFNPGISQLPVVLAGGQVDLKGLELQGTFKATSNLTLEGTFAYAETEIGRTSCTECVAITGVVNPVGNRLPRYPAFSGTASATYEWPSIYNDFDGYVRGDYLYTGEMFDTEANKASTGVSHRVNLRAGVRNGKYQAEIWGRNIFNEKSPTSIARAADQYNSTNTLILGVPLKPTFGVRLGYAF